MFENSILYMKCLKEYATSGYRPFESTTWVLQISRKGSLSLTALSITRSTSLQKLNIKNIYITQLNNLWHYSYADGSLYV